MGKTFLHANFSRQLASLRAITNEEPPHLWTTQWYSMQIHCGSSIKIPNNIRTCLQYNSHLHHQRRVAKILSLQSALATPTTTKRNRFINSYYNNNKNTDFFEYGLTRIVKPPLLMLEFLHNISFFSLLLTHLKKLTQNKKPLRHCITYCIIFTQKT